MLSAIKVDFFRLCYLPLGPLMDDIALLNSSINFVIYYLMSRQFRKNFIETFGLTWCKCPKNLRPQDQQSRNNGLRDAKNEHEMRPLMAPNNPPLVPRRAQIETPIGAEGPLNASQCTVAIAAPKSEPVVTISVNNEQNNGNGGNFILKRTNEPVQQI